MSTRFWACMAVVAGLAAAPPLARTEENPGTTIRAALEAWRNAFNSRNADHICDLFAADLRYDFQGLPEQTYPQLCERLYRALANAQRTFHYDLTVKEVIASGDLAVVRLTWTSTVTPRGGKPETDDEPGLDVFRRQGDGGWKIIRYIAYPAGKTR
ncbi:MAG: nuclear transport factor 2 family protein [Acetobacteraceae bacterium]|nr:nuclear transport factor 2 family protein [Acetobacteraceae bacterium]